MLMYARPVCCKERIITENCRFSFLLSLNLIPTKWNGVFAKLLGCKFISLNIHCVEDYFEQNIGKSTMFILLLSKYILKLRSV